MANPFILVRDTNRKPIRGLWQRGKRYYVQLREPGAKSARKIALDAANLTEAKQAAEDKRREARAGDLPNRGRKPTSAIVADDCLAFAAKKENLAPFRRINIALQMEGSLRTCSRGPHHHTDNRSQRDKRLLSGVSPRTVNLDLIAMRAVFNKCVEDGLIVREPNGKLMTLKQGESRERKFLRPAQLQTLLDEAVSAECSA